MGTRNVTIQGVVVEVSAPYAEGHTVNGREANALNQVRSENVGNNLRTRIKEAQSAGAEQSAIQAIVTEYDKTYDLATAPVPTTRLDPVQKEARDLARARIRDGLAAQGRKISEVDKDALRAEIERIAGLPAVQKTAAANVKAQKGIEVEVTL